MVEQHADDPRRGRATELTAVPLILYPKDPISPFGQQIVGALKAAGAEPAVAYSAVEIYTALSLVAAGLGATLVARSIAENNRTDVVLLPVTDIAASTTVVAVTRAGEKSRLVAAFLAILAGCAPDDLRYDTAGKIDR